MFQREIMLQVFNFKKLHKYAGLTSIALVIAAFIIGSLNNSIAYGFVYFFRITGFYIPFYCLMCIERGDERIMSSGWGSETITRDNHPSRFWFAIAIWMILASSGWISWFTINLY